MVKEEILVKLRSAEEETAKRIAAAKERASDIVKEARREAETLLAQAQDEGRRTEEQKVSAERSRLEKERERILADGTKQEQLLRQHYQTKVAKSVEKALDTFERSV